MASDSLLLPSLPQTVAARRNARLKQWALTAIPLLLFLISAGLRVWEPDLVPFGGQQAKYVADASSRAPVGLWALYADLTVTPLMLVEPVLRQLPGPVLIWVVLRGLLDSLGVVLLFLAARPLVGVWGAGLAALLYAVNPAVWAAARDPAGPLTAVVMAAAMWAGVRLVQCPSLLRVAIFGVALGLLARSGPAGLIVVPLGAVTLALGRASWRVGGVTALALVLVAGPALFSHMRRFVDGGLSLDSAVRLSVAGLEGEFYPQVSGLVLGMFSPFPGRVDILSALPLGVTSMAFLVSPTLVALIACGVVSVLAARRGQPVLLLAGAWVVFSALATTWLLTAESLPGVLFQTDWAGIQAAGELALVPQLSLLLVVPMVAPRSVIRWGGVAAVALLLFGGSVTLTRDISGASRAEWERTVFARKEVSFVSHTGPVGPLIGRPFGASPSLREAQSLADAVTEATARTGTPEVVISHENLSKITPTASQLPLMGDIAQRGTPFGVVVLPLERETAYLVSTGVVLMPAPTGPMDLSRPSSSQIVFTPAGADTGARIVTLRPRPAADWLARATVVSAGRYIDGSALVGVRTTASSPGRLDVAMYWELPAAADGRSLGERIELTLERNRSVPVLARLPIVEVRRGGELVIVSVALTGVGPSDRQASIFVRLLDGRGGPVRTQSGALEVEAPVSRAPQ